jgi:hypothetical protein
VFDHTAVTGTCSSCHNGTNATGKSPTHIQSSNTCDACHSTATWSPVTTVDHDAVMGSCSSCHNGTAATGKPSNHFVTTQQCDACHNTTDWTFSDYEHTSGNFPGNHGPGVQCIDCHTGNSQTATWTYTVYKPDCAGCHAGDFKASAHKKYENPDTFYNVSELRDCSGTCHQYTNSSMTTIKEFRSGEHHPSHSGFD